ncbi:MAG TPA: AMP-binding protein [Solirubrobacteraceae bacterium]|nr:AMP-binding protein [Solirubrobacteraceae bacterium]
MLIQDLLRRAAREFGDAPAIVDAERVVSFVEFEQSTVRLANALLDRGLAPGDRLAVALPNCIEELLVYCALARAGLLRVGLNARDTPADQAFKVQDADCRAVISDGSAITAPVELTFSRREVNDLALSGRLDRCDIAVPDGEPYRIAYTGGTTGRPKGVMLTLGGLHAQLTNYLLEHVPGIEPGDVMLHAAPVSHASGSYFLPHLVCGGVNVLLPRFRPGEFLEELERRRARRTFLVPTMMAALLEEPNLADVDASSMRRLCYGASPIAPAVARRSEEVFGQVLCQTYGQAEAPMTISLLRPEEHGRVGSAGRPYKMTAVRVVDDAGEECPRGESGEVVARGPIVMAGYWRREAETASTLAGGWLHTGDIGYMDDAGYLFLLDRRNDMIISGGFNVYPREVEDVLLEHPSVMEAAVVGVSDEKWGEVIHAVVTTRAQVPFGDLDEHLQRRIAGYKRPRAYHTWPELPKSAAGKILRRAVRDALRKEGSESAVQTPEEAR